MDKFASADTLMGRLQRGEYKCPVMANDDSALDFFDTEKAEKAFETAFENYQEHTSRPDNYTHLDWDAVRRSEVVQDLSRLT